MAAAGWSPYLPAARMRECATIGLQDYPTQLHLPLWPPNSPAPLLEIHTPPPSTLPIHRHQPRSFAAGFRRTTQEDGSHDCSFVGRQPLSLLRSCRQGEWPPEACRCLPGEALHGNIIYHTSPCNNFSVTCSIFTFNRFLVHIAAEYGRLRHSLDIMSQYLQNVHEVYI